MCLLLTLMAAVAATVAWNACEKRKTYRLGTLCLIYWGAGLMWLVDFFFEYFAAACFFARKILDKSDSFCHIMHKMDEFHHFPLHFFIEYV